ncbi:MAG: hypothetical protein JW955_12920, partial [Sedimentisphaerales bacterium]|nr:hypothetical protein [Sedimentisphaerales bacterium]
IATAADLIALGETPEDYDKHFILTADIDLDPNLPGRRIFDKAVIAAPAACAAFTGVFDGKGHTVSHLTIVGQGPLGLFGWLGEAWMSTTDRGEVRNLAVVDVNIVGSGGCLVGYNEGIVTNCWSVGAIRSVDATRGYGGGLVGANYHGTVRHCHSTGTVSGNSDVGGLVGANDTRSSIWDSYSTCTVVGGSRVGGLVGYNDSSGIICSYSSGPVMGTGESVGGLVGMNFGGVRQCCSTSDVSGAVEVGGLVGSNGSVEGYGEVTQCYSTGSVTGTGDRLGGLIGYNGGSIAASYSSGLVSGTGDHVGGFIGYGDSWPARISSSFWDTQTSGQTVSAGGTGLTTAEMQTAKTFLEVGWDFVGETANGTEDIWWILEGLDYPRLWWEKYSGGTGEPNDPYQIATAADLIALGETPEDYEKHFILTADIDLDPNLPGRKVFDRAVIAPDTDPNDQDSLFQGTAFAGNFDGAGRRVSGLTIYGKTYLGLFGQLESGAMVKDLGVTDVKITGADVPPRARFLCGHNMGALAGRNAGRVTRCYSTGLVSGMASCSGGVGGLVGQNDGSVTTCYSTAVVDGQAGIGGLVGDNHGKVSSCYSTGAVNGYDAIGGLIGTGNPDDVTNSVWDMETSEQSRSAGGVGLTSADAMDPDMLGLNGFADDPNWVLDGGRDYPRLAWEGTLGSPIPEPNLDWLGGQGTPTSPYRIDTADQLILIGRASALWGSHFVLTSDLDLDPNLPGREVFRESVIGTFAGVFDGNGHTIWHLTIEGRGPLALFGQLRSGGTVRNLSLVDVAIVGSGEHPIGALVAYSEGVITNCHCTGMVSGTKEASVGGLVGRNTGEVAQSSSTAQVSGNGWGIGGLIGWNDGAVIRCSSDAATVGHQYVGGLVGFNSGSVTQSCNHGAVGGDYQVGGLVGYNGGGVLQCYSTGAVRGNGGFPGTVYYLGGLVGINTRSGTIEECYSTGMATGKDCVGGLAGGNFNRIGNCYSTGRVRGAGDAVGGLVGQRNPYPPSDESHCFWNIETSGQNISAGGVGLTTVEMQTASTFLDAGWDFVSETANGMDDIWWILEGQDYPRLWWEALKNE